MRKMLRVPVLTNTDMRIRIADGVIGNSQNIHRENEVIKSFGVNKVLYDRNKFPKNPLEHRHILFAGLDPYRALVILLKERSADAILCVFENTALFLLLFRHLFFFKPPIVLLEVSPRGWRLRDMVLDYVVPRVDLVIVLTNDQKKVVERNWKTKRPVKVVDWYVDEEFFKVTELPLDGYVLSVGEDVSRDFETLVAACAKINARLVLKTRKDVKISDEFRDKVLVIDKKISGKELFELYKAARVVVVPLTPTENPGGISSILEAMSVGRPVVASATGVPLHVLTDRLDGVIVPPCDVESLAAALQELLTDDALATRLGKAARKTVEARFAFPARQRKFADALHELVEDR